MIGAAVDHVAVGGRRAGRLEADEAHLARGIRELVRTDCGVGNDRAALTDATAPGVARAVTAQQCVRAGDRMAQIEQEARRGGVRIVEHVVGLRGESTNLDWLAVRVDQASALVETR